MLSFVSFSEHMSAHQVRQWCSFCLQFTSGLAWPCQCESGWAWVRAWWLWCASVRLGVQIGIALYGMTVDAKHRMDSIQHRMLLDAPLKASLPSPLHMPLSDGVPLRGDQLEAAGCKRVKYDEQPRSSHGAYDVIHLSSVVCYEHVVPDFKAEGFFYVSAFSPSRPM